MGTEHNSAALPLRSSASTLARATGSLLPPHLPRASPHFTVRTRVGGTLATIRELRNGRLMQHRSIWLHAKYPIVQLDGPGRAAGGPYGYVHYSSPPTLVCVFLIIRSPPRGPGTPPLTA